MAATMLPAWSGLRLKIWCTHISCHGREERAALSEKKTSSGCAVTLHAMSSTIFDSVPAVPSQPVPPQQPLAPNSAAQNSATQKSLAQKPQAQKSQAPQRPHVDLKSLPTSGFIDGIYSIVNPQVGTTRNGKPYLKCLLRDASGEVAARQWTMDESTFNDLRSTGFVWIAGHVELYNGQPQLILEQIKPVEVSQDELAALLPTTTKNIDQMFSELSAIMRSLQHPAMGALVEAYLTDEDLMNKLRMAPAAMNLHHAWIGGLLEHTLQLLKLAEQMLPLYPQLNRDIVLTGLFLHDLGKTAELTWEKGFDYTADGNLIGHIVRGAIWLQFKAAIAGKNSGHKLPPEALRVLQHIIISHHGVPEFGAAKVPATPEAIFISQLDNLDAKTQMSLTCARPDPPISTDCSEFTEKVWALETRLYRHDPLKLSGH
jgi:3'-5' exoribonuclease